MPNFPCYAVIVSVGVLLSLTYGELATAQQSPKPSSIQPTPQIPATLNSDANLLQLPTQPAEVQLQPTRRLRCNKRSLWQNEITANSRWQS